MTFGSLFAGIGGMDLGLERAGMRCRWQVEIDPYCKRVLAKHWPDVPKYEDVRDVGAHNLERVDLICGGFPCQDISNAGNRAGIGGERSGLWSEFARAVRALRPGYVLVENVSALLARGLGRVLGDLAEGGYDAEWDCIPAAAVGAPHRRDRLFVVAYPTSVGCGEGSREFRRVLSERPDEWAARPRRASVPDADRDEHESRSPENGRQAAAFVLADTRPSGRDRSTERDLDADEGRGEHAPLGHDADGRAHRNGRPVARGNGHGQPREWWSVEPDVGRVAHGVPARVDRLRGLGNAVVPQVAEYIGRLIMAHAAHEHSPDTPAPRT